MCLAQALSVALAARLQKNTDAPRIPVVTGSLRKEHSQARGQRSMLNGLLLNVPQRCPGCAMKLAFMQ
jgi:hypothetical protein